MFMENVILKKMVDAHREFEDSWDDGNNKYNVAVPFTEIFWSSLTMEEQKTAVAKMIRLFGREYFHDLLEIAEENLGIQYEYALKKFKIV